MGNPTVSEGAEPLINDIWDILEITSISGNETALSGETVTYTAEYKHKDPRGQGGEKFIEWRIFADG